MAMETQTALRFLHILSGIVWIGHLYFFNLTNLPVFKMSIKGNDANQKGGPHLMMRAVWWFRWGAMATLVFGLLLMDQIARTYPNGWSDYLASPSGETVAVGALLGIVMWFNVWFIIWPNQKVVLGNNLRIAAGGVADEEKKRLEADNAPRMKKAKNASRFNFWASIPLLFFMVFAAHNPFQLW